MCDDVRDTKETSAVREPQPVVDNAMAEEIFGVDWFQPRDRRKGAEIGV
jgi:hypothetical protein